LGEPWEANYAPASDLYDTCVTTKKTSNREAKAKRKTSPRRVSSGRTPTKRIL